MEIKLLIDGIYQQLFLNGSKDFQALAARENVVVGVYNPVTPAGLFKLNYRMHDKYVIVDDEMYLLGGRNSNDIFPWRLYHGYQCGQGYSGVGYHKGRGRIFAGTGNVFPADME